MGIEDYLYLSVFGGGRRYPTRDYKLESCDIESPVYRCLAYRSLFYIKLPHARHRLSSNRPGSAFW